MHGPRGMMYNVVRTRRKTAWKSPGRRKTDNARGKTWSVRGSRRRELVIILATQYSVSLSKIIREFSLEAAYLPGDPADIKISTTDINRPGLFINGFYEYFDNERIQVLGKMENAFLLDLPKDVLAERMDKLCAYHVPVVIVTRGLEVLPELLDAAKKYAVPVLTTSEATTNLTVSMINFLNTELAPRITRHGVLVEVYGEGIMITGDSGVGKSECAMELIKRGHRLIADDAVEIRKVSNKRLVGTSPDNIRHFMELRGVGIINARRLFGMASVKTNEKIDMIVHLEQWNPEKVYDRMGMETEYTEMLGIKIPALTIPVKPGRNLAVIIEVAAMNNRQKKLGYNAARELLQKLGMPVEPEDNEEEIDEEWDY